MNEESVFNNTLYYIIAVIVFFLAYLLTLKESLRPWVFLPITAFQGEGKLRFNTDLALFHLTAFLGFYLTIAGFLNEKLPFIAVVGGLKSLFKADDSSITRLIPPAILVSLIMVVVLGSIPLLIANLLVGLVVHVFDLGSEVSDPFKKIDESLAQIDSKVDLLSTDREAAARSLQLAMKTLTDVNPGTLNQFCIPLVISCDSQLADKVFSIQVTPFFLWAQHLWCNTVWKDPDPVDYFRASSDADQDTIDLCTELNDTFTRHIDKCIKNLTKNYNSFTGTALKTTFSNNPRVIRLVFGSDDHLMEVASHINPLLSPPVMTSTAKPILNLWISDSISRQMRVENWLSNRNVSKVIKSNFDAVDYRWQARLEDLLKADNIASADFSDVVRHFALNTDRMEYLGIGGKMYQMGYKEEALVEAEGAFVNFLKLLPVIVMGLNYRHVLPFEELVDFLSKKSKDLKEREIYRKKLKDPPFVKESKKKVKKVQAVADAAISVVMDPLAVSSAAGNGVDETLSSIEMGQEPAAGEAEVEKGEIQTHVEEVKEVRPSHGEAEGAEGDGIQPGTGNG